MRTGLIKVAHFFAAPGNWFCERVGQDSQEDSGMLRGYVNSVVWSIVLAPVLWLALA